MTESTSSPTPARIAVYGSAANPPHRGHGDCLAQLLTLGFDRILFMPAAGHAFGKAMQPFEARLFMARLLVAEQFGGDPRIEVSSLEAELLARSADGRVYSIAVLEQLRFQYPNAQLQLALGPDNIRPEVFAKFRAHERLASEFGIVALQQRLSIRSTAIRAELAKAEPDRAWLAQVLGAGLCDYLLSGGFYRGEPAGS